MTQNQWPIAKEGLPFLIPIGSFNCYSWDHGMEGLDVSWEFFCLCSSPIFFRNPRREIPNLQNIILSPADGRIIHVGECEEDRFLKEKALKVSIFMSLFDVHINRAPVSGKVLERSYHPGPISGGQCGEVIPPQ